MKKSNEEDASRETQSKSPSDSSSPERNIQIQHGRADGDRFNHRELTTTDASTYMRDVKEMFKDQPGKYRQFLAVMKDHKAQRMGTAWLVERVKELFKGHDNLIIGFNTFLPKGYEITLNEELTHREGEITAREAAIQLIKSKEYQEALSYGNKITERFVHDDTVSKSFLNIFEMYNKDKKGLKEVYQEVSALFIDHRDLFEESMKFIPARPATPSTQKGVQKGIPSCNYQRNSDVHDLGDVPVLRQRDTIIVYHHSEQGSYQDMVGDGSLVTKYKDQRKPAGNEGKERRSHNKVKVMGDAEHDGTAYIKPQRQHGKRSYALNSDSVCTDTNSCFAKKSKKRLRDPAKYQSFLKLFNIYSSNRVTQEEFKGLVTESLGERPDLIDEFNKILEHCENIDEFISGLMNIDLTGDRTLKAENRDREKMQMMPIQRSKYRNRKEHSEKSIHKLDLSNCRRCTPSYRHLPDDYPIAMASQRSKLGTEVLNDYWVLATSGSEDNFKLMRRNQYEEALFNCEDDRDSRFELDLLIDTAKSTFLRIEELQLMIKETSLIEDGPVHIEDHFSAIHLRCIERLYGDHCLEVLDLLRKSFTESLDVIKIRLKQKTEEWSKTRSGFNYVWAQVYAKNHYNSLDHRSFYFKQQDSKNLSNDSLLDEIKGLKDLKKKEGTFQMESIAGKVPITPCMEFEYSDSELHGDLHRLVQFSCVEVCSSANKSAKMMHFWSFFMAQIIGVAPELLSGDATRIVLASGRQDSQEHFTVVDGDDGGNSFINCGATPIRSSAEGNNPIDKYNSIGLVHVNGTCSDNSHSGKEQHSFNGRGTPEFKAVISDVQHSIKSENRVDVEVVSAISLPNLDNNLEELTQTAVYGCTSAEGRNSTLYKKLRNGSSTIGDDIKAADYHLISDDSIKTEKVEGQLSLTGDSEDVLKPWRKPTDDKRSRNHATEEAVGENGKYAFNDAYVYDKEEESVSDGEECFAQEPDVEEVEPNVCVSKVADKIEATERNGLMLASDDGGQSSMSETFLMTAKPLAKHVPLCSYVKDRKDACVFYGNGSFYILFRLHQILYKRLLFAKMSSTDSGSTKTRRTPDCYNRFMDLLYNLLDGTTNNEDFEGDCRALLGIHSYTLFTLDKLIYKLIKQLQTIVTDEVNMKLFQLFEYEISRKSVNHGESVYQENARLLSRDDEIFRFEFSSCPSRLSIQLLGGAEKPEAPISIFNDFPTFHHGRKDPLDVILQRRKRKLYAGIDEVTARSTLLEGFTISNRLECKLDCKSSKVSYVYGTEDVLFRRRKNRKDLSDVRSRYKSRAERFKKLFSLPQYP